MPYIADVNGVIEVGPYDPRLKDPSFGFPNCPRCGTPGVWNGIFNQLVCRDCAFTAKTLLEWYYPLKGAFPKPLMCLCGHVNVVHRTGDGPAPKTCRKCTCYEFNEDVF